MDMIEQERLNLDQTKYLVLDEYDRLLSRPLRAQVDAVVKKVLKRAAAAAIFLGAGLSPLTSLITNGAHIRS